MRVLHVGAVCLATAAVLTAVRPDLFPQLLTNALIGRQQGGFFLIATNQLLRPAGDTFPISGRPVDLAIDNNGRYLALLSHNSVLLRDASTGAPLADFRT